MLTIDNENSPTFEQLPSDTLYVNWHLLDGINHETEYSREPAAAFDETFSRSALLETAYTLLSKNRSCYVFHFYGGEPTIHPYFLELVSYICSSGRNIYCILDTNGVRSLTYYRNLLNIFPPGRLLVNLEVHCTCVTVQAISYLIAHIVEHGFFCRVSIYTLPNVAQRAKLYFDKLLALRKVLSFDVRLCTPRGQTSESVAEPLALPQWTNLVPSHAQAQNENAEILSEITLVEESYVCLGTNCVQVSKDGKCTLGLREKDRPFALCVVEDAVLREDLPKPPSFDEESEAKNWLANFKAQMVRQEVEGGAVRNPFSAALSLEQHFRAQLKRCQKNAEESGCTCDYAPILWKQFPHILLPLWTRLADAESREVFLRRLKAQTTGEMAYLAVTDTFKLDETLYPKDDPKRRLSLPSQHENVKGGNGGEALIAELSKLSPTLNWYRPALEIRLPNDCTWASVLAVLCRLSRYEVFVRQYTDATFCYALPNSPRRYPKADAGLPWISLVLAAGDDEDVVSASLTAIIDAHLGNYEAVVVYDTDAVAKNIDACIHQDPYAIRSFRCYESLSLAQAFGAGLSMVHGDYVVFLQAGVEFSNKILDLVHLLKQEDADLAICGLPGEERWLTQEEARTAFFEGAFDNVSHEDVIVSRRFLADNVIGFSKQSETLVFLLQCVFNANKIYASPRSLHKDDVMARGEEEETCADAQTVLTYATSYLRANDISLSDPRIQSFALRWWHILREQGVRITQELILALSSYPHIMQECTQAFLEMRPAFPSSPCGTSLAYEVYEGSTVESNPRLTTIVTIRKNDVLTIVERIARDNCQHIDCLVVDASCDAHKASRLDDLADMYPNVRVCHTHEELSNAQCARIGFAEAKGHAVTFLTADDVLSPGFLQCALKDDFACYCVDTDSLPQQGTVSGKISEKISGDAYIAKRIIAGKAITLKGLVLRRDWIAKHLLETSDETTLVLNLLLGTKLEEKSMRALFVHEQERTLARASITTCFAELNTSLNVVRTCAARPAFQESQARAALYAYLYDLLMTWAGRFALWETLRPSDAASGMLGCATMVELLLRAFAHEKDIA